MRAEDFNIFPTRKQDRLIVRLGDVHREVSGDIEPWGFALVLRELCDEYLRKHKK